MHRNIYIYIFITDWQLHAPYSTMEQAHVLRQVPSDASKDLLQGAISSNGKKGKQLVLRYLCRYSLSASVLSACQPARLSVLHALPRPYPPGSRWTKGALTWCLRGSSGGGAHAWAGNAPSAWRAGGRRRPPPSATTFSTMFSSQRECSLSLTFAEASLGHSL